MNKKKKTRYMILGFFYVGGLISDVILMLAIPYMNHKTQLLNMATNAAESYSNNQDFGITHHFGLSYFIYDLEGICTDKYVSGFQDEIYQLNTEYYLNHIQNNDFILRYEQISLLENNTGNIVKRLVALIAAVPLKNDNQIIGCLFLVRNLEDFPNNIYGFVIVWSILFLLLFIFYFLLDKKQEKLDEMQRIYIASMNHELKSPITSIKALSETLLDGNITDSKKQFFYYNTILKEANNLETTVLEILELSKLQSTKNLYKKEICSAETAFGPILERYTNICKDIDLAFHAPDPSDSALPNLYTVPELVSRVFDLLLHNAIKFTDPEVGMINVTFHTEKNHLRIDVKDNGIGISSEDLPHIFDRFYQSEKAHNSQGSGLGLSIAKEIINGLKETIQVESTPGNGTMFSFTISTKQH